jgi:hypothetical protein
MRRAFTNVTDIGADGLRYSALGLLQLADLKPRKSKIAA